MGGVSVHWVRTWHLFFSYSPPAPVFAPRHQTYTPILVKLLWHFCHIMGERWRAGHLF